MRRLVALVVGVLLAPLLGVAEEPQSVLTVTFGERTISLTMEELGALPSYQGMGGFVTSAGKVHPPVEYKGVLLQDLCALVGGIGPGDVVRVIARDGYTMTLTYEQVVAGAFDAYDVATGKAVDFPGPLRPVLAYEREGKSLSEQAGGPLRLVVLGAREVVTDGHWWVKWVEAIEIGEAVEPWVLRLEGAITATVDMATFEAGAAPGCHGRSWQDDKGRTWTGIPLWLFLGYVDDEIQHGDGAFNDALAEAGYTVEVVAADGYTVILDSRLIARNDGVLLAYLLDGAPLPGDYRPLRLVGQALEKSSWVSSVVAIRLLLP
ncbi:molybdopterin-dependent oxidoreductase [Candidatus Bipolaricaulota bacterium]|nr:molybdopterin-dependent oxidoreductase [Candidatus Bipolaricaulota bacterium]